MAQKRLLRQEKLGCLQTDIESLNDTCAQENVNVRTLTLALKDVEDSLAQFKDAHVKYISDEKTTQDEKDAASASYQEARRGAIASIEPAQSKLELAEAATTVAPVIFTPAQQLNIDRERIRRMLASQREKIESLKTMVDSIASPHRCQLDRLHDMVASQRVLSQNAVKECYEPLLSASTSETETIDIDAKMENDMKPLHDLLDALEKTIVEKTPDVAPSPSSRSTVEAASASASAPAPSPAQALSSTYKFYQKSQMPKFDGKVKNFPKWKKEFVESILPGVEESRRVRLLDDHTPESMDLQNCESAEDCWELLDAKYGNQNVISACLIEDFMKYVPKGRSPESKLIDLRNTLVSLKTELTAVNCLDVLTTSTYHMQNIIKIMPRTWQNKWSEGKEPLIAFAGSQFEALLKFVKDEAKRIETDLPWTLDPDPQDIKDSKGESSKSGSSNIDVSKLPIPKHLQKKVNAALAKAGNSGQTHGNNSSNVKTNHANSAQTVSAPKSPQFEEMKKRIGNCPQCGELHTYVARIQQLFVSGSLGACDDFKKANVQGKAELIQKHKACAICFSWGHQRDSCGKSKPCGKGGCTLLHNS